MRDSAIKLILVITSLIFILLVLEIFLRFMPVVNSVYWSPVNKDDYILRHAENSIITYSKHWNFKYKNERQVNNYGFLNNQNYNKNISKPIIAVIGDSYVECMINPYEKTFYGLLSNTLENKVVYSFGVSGAQLSQYLVWLNYVNKEFKPDVIIVPIIANDFDESFYKYKRTRGFHYFDENLLDGTMKRVDRVDSFFRKALMSSSLFRYVFFHLQAGDLLKKVKNLIIKAYNNDKTENRYIGNVVAEVSKEHEQDGMLAIDLFFTELDKLIKPNQKIFFVLDAIRPNIYYDDDIFDVKKSFWFKMRSHFSKKIDNEKYKLIDMQDPFKEHYKNNKIRFEYKTDGHWNNLAHQLVFEQLKKHIDLTKNN